MEWNIEKERRTRKCHATQRILMKIPRDQNTKILTVDRSLLDTY